MAVSEFRGIGVVTQMGLVTDVLYRAMPPFYEDIENAAIRVYGVEAGTLKVPRIVRFASWVATPRRRMRS